MGDDKIAKRYSVEALPVTCLIDGRSRKLDLNALRGKTRPG
jgi:hypothetical protein